MRGLTAALSAALGAPVQTPALLIEMAFAPIRRWSSYADLNWAGQVWTREAATIEDLEVGALTVSGRLVLANGDGAAAALVLGQGVQDRAVRVWGYDAAATAAGDIVWLCDAAAGAAQIGMDFVRIPLRHRCDFVVAPRTFITEAEFAPLLPAGTVLKINGKAVTLNRRN
jgi:hypothetical protein